MHSKSQNGAIFVFGWKYYCAIKNKATEKDFSWSGMLTTLFIAFFVVSISAQGLNMFHQSLKTTENRLETTEKVYRLEKAGQINPQTEETMNKLLGIKIMTFV